MGGWGEVQEGGDICILMADSHCMAETHVRGRGGGQEELPHVQGAVAAQAQECLEELFHVQGQERRRWEMPWSKVRSSGCALLEQP